MNESDIQFLFDGPDDAEMVFIFAHGAGAPMDSPFMDRVAAGLAEAGTLVARFEFPYMSLRRQGRRKGPDRTDVLLRTWRQAIDSIGNGRPLFIGGKSLGGRMATMVADPERVAGVMCFGYPFHPPGHPERLRTQHLQDISLPVLILQGERDPFGTPTEVADYPLSAAVDVRWIPDGDHSLKPRKKSGNTLDGNLALAIREALQFLRNTQSLM